MLFLQETVRPYPTVHGKQTENHRLIQVPFSEGFPQKNPHQWVTKGWLEMVSDFLCWICWARMLGKRSPKHLRPNGQFDSDEFHRIPIPHLGYILIPISLSLLSLLSFCFYHPRSTQTSCELKPPLTTESSQRVCRRVCRFVGTCLWGAVRTVEAKTVFFSWNAKGENTHSL